MLRHGDTVATIDYRRGFSGFFFFQAEDGIRDLVRSRGLGDVYKRQYLSGNIETADREKLLAWVAENPANRAYFEEIIQPVSYTHLTLPTSDLV